MTNLLKADFHIHTSYSKDCDTPLEDIIDRCLKTGINCIAISDHGTAEGALKMKEIAPFKVIIAEEVLTPDGEIMGMCLKETIPSGISIEDAIARIKAQDALVCLPHPFDTLRGIKLDIQNLEKLAEKIDIIEVFNARSTTSGPAIKARDFAMKYDFPGTAGSDAHFPREIGRTYVEMPEFNGKDEFIRALRMGRIIQHKASPFVHLNTVWTKLKKVF
jgi:predicted metal-dependent phosphoesterase TrpH